MTNSVNVRGLGGIYGNTNGINCQNQREDKYDLGSYFENISTVSASIGNLVDFMTKTYSPSIFNIYV